MSLYTKRLFFRELQRQALEFILTTYLTAFTTMRKECFPEIDRLSLIRLTSSSLLRPKIGASKTYKFVAYKLLFP